MTLDQWFARSGVSKHELHYLARVSLPAIKRALEGRASRASAEKIEAAIYARTRNRVPAASMCEGDSARKRVRA